MIRIEVFGPGCQRCRATTVAVEEAIRISKAEVSLVHISDPAEMARQRVMFTPTVRVNGQVKSTGRVPASAEIVAWLAEAASAA